MSDGTAQKRFERVLSNVSYKDWRIIVRPVESDSEYCYLQAVFLAPDRVKGGPSVLQKGRKWLLSKHMIDSEIVDTAFKAILGAEQHETREAFKYKGVSIYTPHIDVDALAEALACGELPEVTRKNPS